MIAVVAQNKDTAFWDAQSAHFVCRRLCCEVLRRDDTIHKELTIFHLDDIPCSCNYSFYKDSVGMIAKGL